MRESVSTAAVAGRIHVIHGVSVMLDGDLAPLYEVPLEVLRQAVRGAAERFPSDFMFELTAEEVEALKSQTATSRRNSPPPPVMAFTAPGVAMLSVVMGGRRAIGASIRIMRAFTRLCGKAEFLGDRVDRQAEAIFTVLRRLAGTTGSMPPNAAPTEAEKPAEAAFTPAARRRWEQLTPGLQAMLLANVWCANCRSVIQMEPTSGRVEKGQLVLRGICGACGNPVARVIERA
jgi:hypothetical protein